MSKLNGVTFELSLFDKNRSDMEKRRLIPNENNMSSSSTTCSHPEEFKFPSISISDFEMDLTESCHHPKACRRNVLPSFEATPSLKTAHYLGLRYDLSPMEAEWEQPKITTMICQSFDPPLEEEQCDADLEHTSVMTSVEAARDYNRWNGDKCPQLPVSRCYKLLPAPVFRKHP